jgi:hypothetical protein
MKKNMIILILFSAITLFVARVGLAADTTKAPSSEPAAGEQINWQVISSSGNAFGQAGSIQIGSTAGQTATGVGQAGDITVYHGFWQFPGCCIIPGDANNDGSCNLGDAVYVNNFVFRPGECATNPPIGCPPPCTAEGDANYDGSVNLGDAVYINNFVFRPGDCATNPPIGCPPQCGPEK